MKSFSRSYMTFFAQLSESCTQIIKLASYICSCFE